MYFNFSGYNLYQIRRIAMFSDGTGNALRLFCCEFDVPNTWYHWKEFDYSFDESNEYVFFRLNSRSKTFIRANRKFSQAVISKNFDKFDLLSLLFYVYRYYLIRQGNVSAHGAVVVNSGQGILFCGVSGAGKSTQANLWCEHTNSWCLNYDKPSVIFDKNDIFVAGSPWSGKEDRFIKHKVPLKAIVFVNKDSDNRIYQLTQAEAYALVHLNYMTFPICDEISDEYDDIIMKLISSVPVYSLHATISEEAVETTYNELFHMNKYLEEKGRKKVMKIREGFKLRQVADEWIVIPRGAHALSFNGAVLLNETGAFIYKKLELGITLEQMVAEVASEYLLELEVAKRDVMMFVDMLKNEGMLEDE
ncbi:MAG: PqqD family peptide modification chaperone [Clostridiales bacterium]|nr:PqqD family peptide modification chaperone [Clostridiales bacterium]